MKSITTREQKIQVSKKALEYVYSGTTLGLGSGTTVSEFITLLAEKIKTRKLKNIRCVSTGPGTDLLCQNMGINLCDFNSITNSKLDMVFDGADEYSLDGIMIKGGGACLLYEKILAYSTDKFILLVDDSKQSNILNTKHPIPLEVVPMALKKVRNILEHRYMLKSHLIRMDERKVGPIVTREGNFLLDVVFADPAHCNWKILERELKCIVGVVETGIFSSLHPTIIHYSHSDVHVLNLNSD